MTNTEHLPYEFTFVTKNDTHYTATRKGATYEIRGENVDSICCVDYSIGSVEFHIKWGDWVITPKQVQPKTSVPKTIYVPDDKYHVVENDGKSIMAYTLYEIDKQPETSLLSRIKSFTEATGANVDIYKGSYAVDYGGTTSFFAKTDEELEKLMNAIVVLDEATRG